MFYISTGSGESFLVKLLDDCTKFDQDFSRFREKVSKISFYYVQTRYPDIAEVDKYTQDEAEQSYKIAQKIVSFVEKKLS